MTMPVFNFIGRRKRAYQQTFTSTAPWAVQVLADLAKFCRANESTFHPDPRIAANLDGRREVFLRIASHMNLSIEQLYFIATQKDKPNE